MLFNSFEFIFGFLPICLLGYVLLGRLATRHAQLTWLMVTSIYYYGYTSFWYGSLFVLSILVNFSLGKWLQEQHTRHPGASPPRGMLLGGVAFNLALLGYFKYTGFLASTVNWLFATDLPVLAILMPPGISFYTFQQIAFLVDCHRGESGEYDFVRYALFVSFFPQLIAGPIVHHKDLISQFLQRTRPSLCWEHLAAGTSLFICGLFKKVVIADRIAATASPIFKAAAASTPVTFVESWVGALGYSLQIYFDFSGYSDMAVGLGLLFSVKIADNFNSPYKADSIIEFWRRWHITLSEFLRDYLYFPLGGNRLGPVRRHVNVMITMLLGGLWHGAGWNFILWGGLHGVAIVLNHLWRDMRRKQDPNHGAKQARWSFFGWALTMFLVVLAWIPFRADTWAATGRMFSAMSGADGISLPAWSATAIGGLPFLGSLLDLRFEGMGLLVNPVGVVMILAGILVATLLPNTNQFFPSSHWVLEPEVAGKDPLPAYAWRPTFGWALVISGAATLCLLFLNDVSEFLYFRF